MASRRVGPPGLERTEPEFTRLLGRAGLALVSTTALAARPRSGGRVAAFQREAHHAPRVACGGPTVTPSCAASEAPSHSVRWEAMAPRSKSTTTIAPPTR